MMIDYNSDKVRYTIKDLTIEDMVNLIDALQLELKIHQLRYEHAQSHGYSHEGGLDMSFIKLHDKIESSKKSTFAKIHLALRSPEEK